MTTNAAPHTSGMTDRKLIAAGARQPLRLSACALAVASCATLLPGCDRAGYLPDPPGTAGTSISPGAGSPIPLPKRVLLTPQAKPNCEYTNTEVGADDPRRLDFERQCYRHAEMVVRDRLQLLQGAVDKTIRAVRRNDQSGL
jgi:hypothetical protein